MRIRVRLAACLLVMLAAGSARAETQNPSLVRARGEIEELRFEAARQSLAEALEWGRNSPAQLAEIHQLAGEVAAGMGDRAAAEEHFRRLLAIDPNARLAVGTSPKIAAPFEAARRFFDERQPLRVRYHVRHKPTPVLLVFVDSDPLDMVAGARLAHASEEAPPVEQVGDGPFELPLPRTGRLELLVSVTDRYGNRLVELGSAENPIIVNARAERTPATPPPRDRVPPSEGRPLYGRWWIYGALAAVSAGAGIYFGIEALRAEDAIEKLNQETRMGIPHDFREAKDLERQGERNALLANVSFGVAGAFAIVSTVLLVRDLTVDEPKRRVSIVPAPTRGGVAVTVELGF